MKSRWLSCFRGGIIGALAGLIFRNAARNTTTCAPREAEAERERRAKIVAAEGEYQAAVKFGEAADIITQHPVALQLPTLQTMAEISV